VVDSEADSKRSLPDLFHVHFAPIAVPSAIRPRLAAASGAPLLKVSVLHSDMCLLIFGLHRS
jgi:hypothetical protein